MRHVIFAILTLLFVLASGSLQAEETYYAIQPGDSLMTISYKFYGTHKKWKLIKQANPNLRLTELEVGQKILITKTKQNSSESQPIDSEFKKIVKTNKVGNTSFKQVTTVNNYYGLEKENAKKVKNYSKLEKSYLDLKEKNTGLRKQLIESSQVKKENSQLKKKILNIRSNLADDFSKQLQAYTDITEVQSKILQEKHRILSQRLWLAKNDKIEKCTLNFAEGESYKENVFYNLVEFLNTKIGKENVFVRPEENKLIVYVPGRAVYGYEDPKVRTSYQKTFSQVSEYMNKLGVQHIYVKGHSRYAKIFKNKNEWRTGSSFVLEQALAIQDYFIEEQGWSPKKFSISSFGSFRTLKNKNKTKRFEMVVQFKNFSTPSRQLAAIDSDVNLTNLLQETMSYVGEPKYSHAEVKGHDIEIHIARDYFWKTAKGKLSDGGKQKLARIMKTMAKVEDATYQFYWLPGVTEKNKIETRKTAFTQLDSLRAYLVKDLDMGSANIETGYKSRLQSLRYPASKQDDNFNKRLLIRVVPVSVSDRPLKK